jgi:hypothetical protein
VHIPHANQLTAKHCNIACPCLVRFLAWCCRWYFSKVPSYSMLICHATSPPSQPQVASYMRAVLRTLAQCHAQRILHRDIKPGNFMLLSEAEDSPLKAIGRKGPMAVSGGGGDGGLCVEHTWEASKWRI